MKVDFCSDVHLEFGPIYPKNEHDADVLVLAGDIFVADDFTRDGPLRKRYVDFLGQVCSEFPQVIYVMGNHEHYHGDFGKTVETLRHATGFYPNLHFLDKQSHVIDDVVFFGGTMWTDMNKGNDTILWDVGRLMNDFQCVKNSNKPDVTFWTTQVETGEKVQKSRPSMFTTRDAMEDNSLFIAELTKTLDANKDKKVFVVTHHAPTFKSINPKYAHMVNMNFGYASDFSELILDNPQIKCWVHGHMHHRQQYQVGDTWVVSNPRGYIGHELIADSFELQFVEL